VRTIVRGLQGVMRVTTSVVRTRTRPIVRVLVDMRLTAIALPPSKFLTRSRAPVLYDVVHLLPSIDSGAIGLSKSVSMETSGLALFYGSKRVLEK
jgi:hypothetical protein